jgi:putative transposase
MTSEKTLPNQCYSQFKTEEKSWLSHCPSQILRNSCSNWFTAKQRFFKGVAANPKKKKKGTKDTITLTSDVFSLQDELLPDGTIGKKLFVGAKNKNIGFLKFYAHREFGNPNQIVIGKKNGAWYVSFSYENEKKEKTEEELLQEYSQLDEETLKEITIGIDRGIVIPFQTSTKLSIDFSENAKKILLQKQRRIKKYQKKLAKQKKDSVSRKKTRAKIAKAHEKIFHIRHDFCHKTSHDLAISEAKIFAVEDLKLKNMTKKPAPKKDKSGKYLPNMAAAKAGLNRELLSKGLAKTIEFLEYKARKHGKLVVKVSPHYSSQECAKCGHTHPDNRKTQSLFSCLSCGNQDNADNNAAKIIAMRGVKFLLSRPKAKTRTRLGISRSKAGRGISKTKLDLSNSQIPMTSEARSL